MDIDHEMQQVSNALDFSYYRPDRIEVLLCESQGGRDLKIKDMFRHGQQLFRLDDEGSVLVKEFGKNKEWKKVKHFVETTLS